MLRKWGLALTVCVALVSFFTVISITHAAQDGGDNLTSQLWAKAVLKPPGKTVTLKWKKVGSDITPSGAQVVSGYFYADPNDFAYGSQYNPEVFVKVYIDPGGWTNIAFNHVTVDAVTVYSAHNYGGTPNKTGEVTLSTRLAEHQYDGVSIDRTLSAAATVSGDEGASLSPMATGVTGGGYVINSGLWEKAVLKTAGKDIPLIWKEVGADTTLTGARVVSGYFYADPKDFAYGSVYNPEIFVKIYIDPNGWANIATNHVTVDEVAVYSSHNYNGTANRSSTASLQSRLVQHEYTGVIIEAIDEPINPAEYQPGMPAPTTADYISTSQSAPAGSAANIVLDDGSQVEIPALLEGFDAQLERFSLSAADDVQSVLNTLADTTDLTPTGAVRQLRVDGSGDGASLQAAFTIPASELGTINPATLNVLRVGEVHIDGQLTQDTRLLSATVDDQGNLIFVDPLLREGLQSTSPTPMSATMQYASGGAGGSWSTQARYVVVSFQGSLNWNRPPYLIRMKPLPGDGARGYRRPVTSAERAELAKQPICNVVLLVHGHNEEEKGGSSVATSQQAPWLFNYKRLVWEQFYQEITRTQVAGDGTEKPVYPYECTAFYEFIFPTYRPIFSEIVDAGGTRHETLGDALGVMIQQEMVNDPQLKAMIQNDMPFNVMIVAHSQGGLVARAGLRQMPQEFKDRTVRLVTWGSPHRGAPLYTLRYSFEAGHAMEINGVQLPFQEITNNWFWGPRYREALDGHVAIDAPGIRDLRWESDLRPMLNMDSLFPTLTPQAEAELKIPIYSQNLSAFNADTGGERIAGGYTFIVGETSKRVDLSFDDVFQAYYFITGSTSIEQGATLNSLLVRDVAEKTNDGAVPLISQQARGLSFPHPTTVVNLGNIDHEEFYGAEPAQRTPQALERGRLTATTTFTELGLKDSVSSCPAIEDIELTPEDGEIRISGRLVFPAHEIGNGGDGAPGQRIERIEVRKRNQEGALVTGMDFKIEDDGTFEWSGAPDLLPEEAIVLLAVLKDGSEVVGEVDQITVTIMPPRMIVYELKGGATEATDTFEAYARPNGLYRYEWNFGDGSAAVDDTPAAGQSSRVSHTFKGLKDGDNFYPSVKLFSQDGTLLSQDAIAIRVDVVTVGDALPIISDSFKMHFGPFPTSLDVDANVQFTVSINSRLEGAQDPYIAMYDVSAPAGQDYSGKSLRVSDVKQSEVTAVNGTVNVSASPLSGSPVSWNGRGKTEYTLSNPRLVRYNPSSEEIVEEYPGMNFRWEMPATNYAIAPIYRQEIRLEFWLDRKDYSAKDENSPLVMTNEYHGWKMVYKLNINLTKDRPEWDNSPAAP